MTAPPRSRPVPPAPAGTAMAAPSVAVAEDARAALAALRATGASRWEALGLLAASLGPETTLPIWRQWARSCTDAAKAVRALDEVAEHAPDAAGAWLGTWLAGRCVTDDLELQFRPWVTFLPVELEVTGSLFVNDTGIVSLPEGLKVGKTLHITNTIITELPRGLTLGRALEAFGCARLTALPQDFPRKLHHLILIGTEIGALPEGLEIARNLYLDGTPIATLPSRMRVGEALSMARCAAWDGRVPAGVQAVRILTDRHNGSLADWRERFPEGERGVAP